MPRGGAGPYRFAPGGAALHLLRAALLLCMVLNGDAWAWNDEIHIAIAKRAGYRKWYNAAGADLARLKAGPVEGHNHFVNNAPGTVVTSRAVMEQVPRYNRVDENGHLYGAIIATIRDCRREKKAGGSGARHLSFCAHYIGDLSQPLHNSRFNAYNQRYHRETDGILNGEVLAHLDKIPLQAVSIRSEADIAREVARIATLCVAMADRLEREERLITRQEAYAQLGYSASLFKAVLEWLNAGD